ncbi:YozQ family protein [Virgibacillus kekensis]|uniref:YozQ family protein n=1 Tax=Virgibacillus kekensis TaxID=202261 RepID=A0ABV9DH66_9BACI
MDKHKRETIESAKKVGDKTFDTNDYNSSDQTDQGTAITHEQATDDYTEGTIDGKIDKLGKNGQLENSEGESIRRKGFDE